MKTIEETYAPFNYSTTRCYVIPLTIEKKGYTKVEHKLPSYIKELKAVFITNTFKNGGKYAGILSLNFNGDAFKSVQLAICKTYRVQDNTGSLPLNETIKPNSFLQGYYFDMGSNVFPYRLSIYLHYTPVP